MTPRQQIFSILVALAIFIIIFYLVRSRRLREEYSWLWLVIGLLVLISASFYGLMEWLTGMIGSMTVTTTLFLFALIFLVLLNLQFSVAISLLVNRVKNLTQEVAILKAKFKDK